MKPPSVEFLNGSREATRFIFRTFFGATDAWVDNGEFVVKFSITVPCSGYRSTITRIPIDEPFAKICAILKDAQTSIQAIEAFQMLFLQALDRKIVP